MLEFGPMLDIIGNGIYVMQAYTAVHGLFLVVLAFRRIAQKRFASVAASDEFLAKAAEPLQKQDYEAAVAVCDSPPYWAKATPQLLLLALQKRDLPPVPLREFVGEKFERDVLADMDYRMAWINTLVKTAPMLGLLGTVIGMISAFAKIASRSRTGVDPSALASDISFALFTTAIGLMIAIPLVVAGSAIQVRMSRLQDSVQEQMGWLLGLLEQNRVNANKSSSPRSNV